jgi:hypothetical protein
VCPRCLPPLLTSVSAMRIARRCRRCGACGRRLSMRVPTPTQTVHHIVVLQHVDKSLADDNAMRVAQASVLLAQFGVSFDPFGGAKSRVTVSAYSAPRLAEARQATRTRGAGRVLSSLRTYSMIDSVDDVGSGAPSSAGRRLMRALASLASTSLCTAMCASDTAGRRRCRRVSARSFRRSRHFTTRTRTRASATPISARRSTSVWPWRRRPTRTGVTACWRRSC